MNRRGEARREILEAALAALKRCTGLAAVAGKPPAGAAGIDALVKIRTDRSVTTFAAQVKTVDRFQTPAQVKAKLAHSNLFPLLVTRYLSRQTAEHCRGLHLPFLDTAGNVYLEAPGLYVYVAGQPRPEKMREPRFHALSAAGLQVSFALLSRPALIQATYRRIASAAGTALGSMTGVMRDLEARGLAAETPHGRRLLDPRRLLDEWVTHYPITLRPKLNARRFQARAAHLAGADLASLRAFWGSECAAERMTRFLKPAAFTIYAHKPLGPLLAALRPGARAEGAEANLEILDAFWHFEPDPNYPDLVPPVLAYADLLATGDGRNIEAANWIYERHIAPTFGAASPAQ